MKKVRLLPNILTATGLAFSLFVIFKLTLMDPNDPELFHHLELAAGLLLASTLFDLLDGAVARYVKAESAFGLIFDSLADAVSFGVTPSIFLLRSLQLEPRSELLFLLIAGALIFSTCGVLRLARFSSEHILEKTDQAGKVFKTHFTGLPIPAAAICAVSANLFLLSKEVNSCLSFCAQDRAFIMIFVMSFLGYLMVSNWKFSSLKALEIDVRSYSLVFIAVCFSVLMLYGILHHFTFLIFLSSWSYLSLSLLLSILRTFSG